MNDLTSSDLGNHRELACARAHRRQDDVRIFAVGERDDRRGGCRNTSLL